MMSSTIECHRVCSAFLCKDVAVNQIHKVLECCQFAALRLIRLKLKHLMCPLFEDDIRDIVLHFTQTFFRNVFLELKVPRRFVKQQHDIELLSHFSQNCAIVFDFCVI